MLDERFAGLPTWQDSGFAGSISVTMIRFDRRQRAALSDTLRELANLAAVAFVLSQFVTRQPLSWGLMLMGIVLWVAFVGVGLVLEGE